MAKQKSFLKKRVSNDDFTETIIIVTGMFFLWGFITSMNGILLPKLQVVFHLDRFNTIIVQSAFFAAYFIFSFIYYIVSLKKDPIIAFGFRNAMITGLVIAGVGCALFYPAAEYKSYNYFLTALFVLAGGITILQIGANPYISHLGDQKNSASRLILSQAINSVGTTLAPFTGLLIFTNTQSIDSTETVKLPYLGLCAALLFFSFLLSNTTFPNLFETKSKKEYSETPNILRYRHLILGFVAIFMYVGAEVSIGSFIGRFIELEEIGGIPPSKTGSYLSFYWGSAMVGRFFGALYLSQMKKKQRDKITLYLVFFVITASFLFTKDITLSIITIVLVIIQALTYYIAKFQANKTLGYFAILIILLLLIGALTKGHFAMWSIISIGLFNSIMFPIIMTLGTKMLGSKTYQGSSILIMGIVGGALIPPFQEVLSEQIGLQFSFLLPIICYTFISFYGFWFSRPKTLFQKLND